MKTVRRLFAAILVLTVLLSSVCISASAAAPDSTAGTVTTGSGNLNIRSSASTDSPILTKLPAGTCLTLLSKNGDWWYVEYAKGQNGYCSASYITQIPGTYAAYALNSLNVRTGAGTSYSISGWLNSGDYVVVISSSGTWKKIVYSGSSVGYVNGAYLKAVPYTPISLSVPSYKQTDSRWSDVPIGSYGDTIGSIGCSTVSLAMSESYRTGTVIYPNVMKDSLSYTPGGAVYWPGNYTAYFDTDYLAVIYNQLKMGKPVLMGSKDSSGGQHWVVVTGFNGGTSLTSSGFIINDPGSSSRTTLQQYFNVYQNFYKIMYY